MPHPPRLPSTSTCQALTWFGPIFSLLPSCFLFLSSLLELPLVQPRIPFSVFLPTSSSRQQGSVDWTARLFSLSFFIPFCVCFLGFGVFLDGHQSNRLCCCLCRDTISLGLEGITRSNHQREALYSTRPRLVVSANKRTGQTNINPSATIEIESTPYFFSRDPGLQAIDLLHHSTIVQLPCCATSLKSSSHWRQYSTLDHLAKTPYSYHSSASTTSPFDPRDMESTNWGTSATNPGCDLLASSTSYLASHAFAASPLLVKRYVIDADMVLALWLASGSTRSLAWTILTFSR